MGFDTLGDVAAVWIGQLGDDGAERWDVRVDLDRPTRSSTGAVDVAIPIIDGVPLFQMLGDRYPGVAVELVAPPFRQWTGDVALIGRCGQTWDMIMRAETQNALAIAYHRKRKRLQGGA